MKYLIHFSLFVLLIFSSCTKESLTFTSPSEYTYTKTNFNSQKVFELINGTLTETLQHPFDKDIKLIKDSTAQIMKSIFETGQITTFQFIDEKLVKVKGTENKNPYEIEGPYTLNGLKLLLNNKDAFISFTETFEELNYCGEISIIKGKTNTGQPFYIRDFIGCYTNNHLTSAQNIRSKYIGWTFEYIAVIYMDMNYKKK